MLPLDVGRRPRRRRPPPLPADRAASPTAISLSAGDLDEATITALSRSDDSANANVNGIAFEKIAAFRNGVLEGFAACRTQLE